MHVGHVHVSSKLAVSQWDMRQDRHRRAMMPQAHPAYHDIWDLNPWKARYLTQHGNWLPVDYHRREDAWSPATLLPTAGTPFSISLQPGHDQRYNVCDVALPWLLSKRDRESGPDGSHSEICSTTGPARRPSHRISKRILLRGVERRFFLNAHCTAR